MAWKLDVSVWNLGCAVALLAACGPQVSSDSDASTTGNEGEACNEGGQCAPGYSCIDGMCRYEDYCDDYCGCGASVQDGDRFRCGPWYECYSDSECDESEICEFGYCVPGEDPPPPPPDECPIPLPLAELPITFAASGMIAEMSAADVDAAAGVELLVARGTELQMVVAAQAITIATTPTAILDFAAGDVDADGDLDLVTIEDGDAALVRIWFHDETGFVEGMSTQPLDGGSDLALADLDADGDLEVLARQGQAVLAFDLVDGVLAAPMMPVQDLVDTFAVLDADLDGRADVLYSTGGTLSLTRLGDPTMSTNLPDLELMHAIVVADFSADGTPDAFIVGDGAEPIQASLVGPFFDEYGSTSAIEAGFRRPAVGELDGDGHADVVIAGDTNHVLVRYGWLAGNIKTGPMQPFHCDYPLATSLNTSLTALADFDADGRTEIAITDRTNVLVLDF
ncbi:MAG TPA: VCBS repeat-containing protein [Nannocystaceae bacterium]|nr:VCBS repeat-containing protein [Nannocystaceae bacterium]